MRRKLAALQLIVPSPMTARIGRTQEGKESAHALKTTGSRRFLVIEFDRGGVDEHATLLLHLAARAPLAIVVHSGNKSLHGWFYCAGQAEERLQRFMRYAVSQLALERCTIRDWCLDDAALLAKYANNRRVWLGLRDLFPHPYTIDDANEFLQRTTIEQPRVKFCVTSTAKRLEASAYELEATFIDMQADQVIGQARRFGVMVS